jgi:large subunit ribosomal protein L21e
MGRRAKGFCHKTRSLLSRKPRESGKIGLSKILHGYVAGEKVVVKINPSVHKGMPHRRYHGKVGVIVQKKGRSYVVNVTQGDAVKEIIVRPEHLDPYTAVGEVTKHV